MTDTAPASYIPGMRYADRYCFVVRRDHADVFLDLEEHFVCDRDIRLIWDRRFSERRRYVVELEPERRRGERRGSPPPNWLTQGYVFVSPPRQAGAANAAPDPGDRSASPLTPSARR